MAPSPLLPRHAAACTTPPLPPGSRARPPPRPAAPGPRRRGPAAACSTREKRRSGPARFAGTRRRGSAPPGRRVRARQRRRKPLPSRRAVPASGESGAAARSARNGCLSPPTRLPGTSRCSHRRSVRRWRRPLPCPPAPCARGRTTRKHPAPGQPSNPRTVDGNRSQPEFGQPPVPLQGLHAVQHDDYFVISGKQLEQPAHPCA